MTEDPKNSLAISVVIPTLNRDAVLCDTLRYFLDDERYPNFELIVIDQSSHHERETERFLEANAHRMRYVRTDYVGLPKARNHGTMLASGDVIVFVDDDVRPTGGFLAAHARHYEEATVTGVAGAVLSPGQRLRTRADITDDEYQALITDRAVVFDVDFEFPPQWAFGCNASFRRQSILDAGGFDEGFQGPAIGEDAEFCHRVKQRGKLRYAPQALLVHLRVPSGGTRDAASDRRYVRDVAYCVNYFYFRVGAGRALRAKKDWQVLRQYVVNRRVFRQGRMLSLIPAFCAGIIESERVVRRSRTHSWQAPL